MNILDQQRRILVVINPAAGNSTFTKPLEWLESELKNEKLHYESFYTTPNDQGGLRKLLQSKPALNEILILGGDGTLNYVVNEVLGRSVTLGMISIGTGNDSIKSLHGVLDLREQVNIAVHGETGLFDLGLCNGKAFVNGVGIGFDGRVVEDMSTRKNKSGSQLDYLKAVLRNVLFFKEKPLSFSVDGRTFRKTILFLTISNGTTFGGGFKINPFASSNDGLLDLCLIRELAPLKRILHLPKLRTGAHHKLKETEFYTGQNIEIEATEQLVAHLDGEFIGHPPFSITVLPGTLKMRIPSKK